MQPYGSKSSAITNESRAEKLIADGAVSGSADSSPIHSEFIAGCYAGVTCRRRRGGSTDGQTEVVISGHYDLLLSVRGREVGGLVSSN